MTGDPTARYKEIVAGLVEARSRVARYEQQRAEELATELAAAEERLAAASERRERVRRSASQWWQQAERLLQGKRWLAVGELPDAASAPPLRDHGRIHMQHAYLELENALHLIPRSR